MKAAIDLLQYLIKSQCIVPLLKTAIDVGKLIYDKIAKKTSK